MEKKPKLNIVIPVYNEEDELEGHTETLIGFLKSYLTDFDWTITIADNASVDKTLVIARKLAKKYLTVRAFHLDKKGRGRAVKKAWMEIEADVHCYMDVDLSTDLKHIPPLVRSLLRGYDIAIGTRNAESSKVYGRGWIRTLTSKTYITLIRLLFFVRFTDSELLIVAEKLRFRIYEEAVTWIDNPGSTVRVVKTAQGDLEGLWRLFKTRPWKNLSRRYG